MDAEVEKEIKVLGSLVKDNLLEEKTATSIAVKLMWGVDKNTPFSFEEKVQTVKSLISKGLIPVELCDHIITNLVHNEATNGAGDTISTRCVQHVVRKAYTHQIQLLYFMKVETLKL